LAERNGRLIVGNGAFDGPYSFKARLEEGQSATNPEELFGGVRIDERFRFWMNKRDACFKRFAE
jgi:hypothetical protein